MREGKLIEKIVQCMLANVEVMKHI